MLSLSLTVAIAAVLGASAFGSSVANNTLVISHVMKGCHTWAYNGAKPAVNQTIRLHAGQSLVLRNNDVMPHQLVKVSGPTPGMKLVSGGMMSSGMIR